MKIQLIVQAVAKAYFLIQITEARHLHLHLSLIHHPGQIMISVSITGKINITHLTHHRGNL
jgi:hypothetical protein